MSDLSLQALVVITLHLSPLTCSPTLLASFVKVHVVCCMLLHESPLVPCRQGNLKAHKGLSLDHVIPPVLMSVHNCRLVLTMSLKKVRLAIKQLKNGKSAGVDSIQLKLLKYSDSAVSHLTDLCNMAWQQ